eukprot:7344958-Karenia_brevis.AAC.1
MYCVIQNGWQDLAKIMAKDSAMLASLLWSHSKAHDLGLDTGSIRKQWEEISSPAAPAAPTQWRP